MDRPLNLLNVLVRGISERLTETARVERGGQVEFSEGREESAVTAMFPVVDFVFIVGVIMSLLALAFSYDSVSGEHESGVLKLFMSYSVPRDTLILGKWIGGYLALVGPFLIAFFAGLLVAVVMSDISPDVDDTLSVIALLGLGLLYVAALYSMGMLVSCRTEVAATSITVLLLLWVVFVLAIPNMAPYVATQLLPIPSREGVERRKQAVQEEGQREAEEMVETERERTGKDRPWEDPEFMIRLTERWEKTRQDIAKLEESYAARIQWQTRWSGIVARVSPLTSFNLGAYDLAAAGIQQEASLSRRSRNTGKPGKNTATARGRPLENYKSNSAPSAGCVRAGRGSNSI